MPLAVLLVPGLIAGFAVGLFGVGGGFVVVVGDDEAEYAQVAITTSAATIIVTSVRSVRAHTRCAGALDRAAGGPMFLTGGRPACP